MTEIDRKELEARISGFASLLLTAVGGGASLGFLAPLPVDQATAYWRSVGNAIGEGRRILLAILDGGQVLGTVQLDLAQQPNGNHRAEVMKLIVAPEARRQGLGRQLMGEVEVIARREQRSLLLLDTVPGDNGERLYRALGWREAGRVPRYARRPDGVMSETIIFYREVGGGTGS